MAKLVMLSAPGRGNRGKKDAHGTHSASALLFSWKAWGHTA